MTVDAAGVERELDRIQRELTNSEVRASLFNLVVVSQDAESSMGDSALTYLLGKRAARVIHIARTPAKESSLEVSARCFVDRENKGVCFQEIVIRSGQDAAGDSPGSWVPLLVRDIPTFVFWLERLDARSDMLGHALEQADKIILDSERNVELGDDPDRIVKIIRDMVHSGSTAVSDFAFLKLRPLQRLIAGAFDDPGRTPLLNQISSVSMRGLSPSAAIYLPLWLASRIGWTAANGDFIDREGRGITVDADDSWGGQVSVTLEFHSGERIVVGMGEDGCAEVGCEDEQLHAAVAMRTTGELLLEEVDSASADPLFHMALTQ